MRGEPASIEIPVSLQGIQGNYNYLSGNDEFVELREQLSETRFKLHETRLEADRFRCAVEHEARIKELRTLAVGYLWLFCLGLWVTGLMATNMLPAATLAPGGLFHWLYDMRQMSGWTGTIAFIVYFAL